MDDEWRKRLEEVIEADGRSLRAISQAAGYGPNYVQQMLKNKKDPTFPKLAQVLSVLGTKATVYVTSGVKLDTGAQLRSALIAVGLDKSYHQQVMDIIAGFPGVEIQGEIPSPEQTAPASRLHEPEQSR